MNAETVAFTILSLSAISGAILMVSLSRVVHMAIALALVFLSIAGIYLLLSAQFLAVIQILVYAGGISILMLFGIMLTHHQLRDELSIGKAHTILTFSAISIFLIILLASVNQVPITLNRYTEVAVGELGKIMLTSHVIAFEVMSILLFVALVGSILIARKKVNP